jgi:ADP-heptose:LPS heptosyltransferase
MGEDGHDTACGRAVLGLIGAARRRRLRRRESTSPERVLLLRSPYDNLGDMVLFSGALRHFRQLYRESHLTLAVPGAWTSLFELCPHVDDVLPLSELQEPWSVDLAARYPAWRQALLSLRNAGRFDRVIFARRAPAPEDHDLVASLGPAWAFGIAGDTLLQSAERDRLAEQVYDDRLRLGAGDEQTHDLEVTRRVLVALGSAVTDVGKLWPEFWLDDAARQLASEWLTPRSGEGPVLCCAPTGYLAYKEWPVDRYAPLFGAIAPCVVVLLGRQKDALVAARVTCSAPASVRVVNLTGQTSIREAIAVVDACDAFVGVDSAPVHVAIALRKPSVCIMGGGHWGRFLPWGDERLNRVVTKTSDCFGCRWTCRRGGMPCLTEITADSVAAALRGVIDLAASRGPGRPEAEGLAAR